MNVHRANNDRTRQLVIGAVALLGVLQAATGQETAKTAGPATTSRDCPGVDLNASVMKTYYLHNTSQPNDGNEILTGLRLMLSPSTKLYLVPSQNAIVLRGCPDDYARAQKLIDDLDRPRKKFRLTYTITESDGGKRIGVQHVSLFAQEAQRTTLKNGSKVPIVTGSINQDNQTQTQMTYLDIGLSFDATATSANGDEVTLKSRVDQSSIAEEKSGVGPQDPVVRQSTLENVALLTQGKPQVLGSLDITGTTRHLEIEVVADPVK